MAQTLISRLLAPVVTAYTDVVNAWTKQQGFPQATLTDASTIAWNGETQQSAVVTLGGNRTLGAISNPVAGHWYSILVVQDSNGTRTLDVSNSIYQWANAVTPVAQTGSGKKSLIIGYYDGSKLLCSMTKF